MIPEGAGAIAGRHADAGTLPQGKGRGDGGGETGMQRIAIVGSPGSGKSTLAVRLDAALALRVIHLDQLHWLPGWELRPKQEARLLVAERLRAPAWIVEGDWFHCMDLRIARADTLVVIDLPAWHCVGRVLRRIASSYGRTRSDMAPACPERFDPNFLWFVWQYRKRGRFRVLSLHEGAPARVDRHHLRSQRELDAFVDAARRSRHGG